MAATKGESSHKTCAALATLVFVTISILEANANAERNAPQVAPQNGDFRDIVRRSPLDEFGASKRKPILNEFAFPSNLVQGMRFVLMCQVLDGDLPLDIRWLRDGKELSAGSEEVRSLDLQLAALDSLGSSILFRSVQHSQAGNYTCLAANEFGKAAYSAQMSVKVPPKWRLEPRELTEATMNAQITIDCQALGNPSPFIRWKFAAGSSQQNNAAGDDDSVRPLTNGRLVASNQHLQTLENGSLAIRAASKDDEGVYVCEADNGVGASLARAARVVVRQQAQILDEMRLLEPSTSGVLVSTSPFSSLSHLHQHQHQHQQHQHQLQSPQATIARAVRLAPTGGQLRLACEMIGEQPLTIDWFKDGRRIYTSSAASQDDASPSSSASSSSSSSAGAPLSQEELVSRVHVSNRRADVGKLSGVESELLVAAARRADAGLYQCAARNLYGAADRRLQLVVQEAPSAPDAVDVAHISSRSVSLRWHAPFDGHAPISKYLVEYRKLSDFQSSADADATPFSVSEKLVLRGAQASGGEQSQQQQHQHQQLQQQHLQQQLQHSVADLEPLTRYSMRVIAVNAIGRSKPSVALSLRTEEEVPSVVPIGVQAVVLSSRAVRLRWKTQFAPSSELVDGFFVGYRSLDSQPTQLAPATSAPSAESGAPASSQAAAATTLQQPTSFTYKTVRLTSPLQQSDQQLLQTTRSELGTQLAPISSETRTIPTQGGAPRTLLVHTFEFVIDNLNRNTEYTILIQCFNRKGAGPTSDPLVVRTLTNDPPEKLLLSAEEITESSIKVKWALQAIASKAAASRNEILSADEPLVDGFVLMFARLSRPNQRLGLHVSSSSAAALAHLQQQQHQHQQSHLMPPPAAAGRQGAIDWQVIQLAPAARSHLLADLECGSSYALKMYAFNKIGKGELSDTLTATTWGKAPIAPDKRSFLTTNSTFVKLHLNAWYGAGCDMHNFVVKYRLRRPSLSGQPSGEWHLVSSNIPPDQQTVLVADLAPATAYELRVTATNAVGSTEHRFRFTTLGVDGKPISRALLGSRAGSNPNNNNIDADDDDDDALDELESLDAGGDGASLVRDFFWSRDESGAGAIRRFADTRPLLAVTCGALLATTLGLLAARLLGLWHGFGGSGSERCSANGQSSASSLASSAASQTGTAPAINSANGVQQHQQHQLHQTQQLLGDEMSVARAVSQLPAANAAESQTTAYGELGAASSTASAYAPFCAAADVFANYASPCDAQQQQQLSLACNHPSNNQSNYQQQQQLMQMLMLQANAEAAAADLGARHRLCPFDGVATLATARHQSRNHNQSQQPQRWSATSDPTSTTPANKPHYAATLAGYHHQTNSQHQRQQTTLATFDACD